jgi:hypothetical protein
MTDTFAAPDPTDLGTTKAVEVVVIEPIDSQLNYRRLRGELSALVDLLNGQDGVVLTHESLGDLADTIQAAREGLLAAVEEVAENARKTATAVIEAEEAVRADDAKEETKDDVKS